jgi:hypothetical protein
MLEYIKNILPRLQKLSKRIDEIENFVGKEWILIDDNGNNQSYEFLRDGRLIITSVTGQNTMQETFLGHWELLESQRLLISRPQGNLTLRQGFLGKGFLILQLSGTVNVPFCCYDPKVIPDIKQLSVYLEKLVSGEKLITSKGGAVFHRKYSTDKGIIEVIQNNNDRIKGGDKVTNVNGQLVPDGKYIFNEPPYEFIRVTYGEVTSILFR